MDGVTNAGAKKQVWAKAQVGTGIVMAWGNNRQVQTKVGHEDFG